MEFVELKCILTRSMFKLNFYQDQLILRRVTTDYDGLLRSAVKLEGSERLPSVRHSTLAGLAGRNPPSRRRPLGTETRANFLVRCQSISTGRD